MEGLVDWDKWTPFNGIAIYITPSAMYVNGEGGSTKVKSMPIIL